MSVKCFPTAEALADAVANHVVTEASAAIERSGRFTLCLAGGDTPRSAYTRLAGADYARHVEWDRVHVVWSDERCVPPDDPRSNYRMAYDTLLRHVSVPPDQVHRIRGEDDPEAAAAAYERVLRDLLADGGLDLVLLGLGADGHTASLFPGQAAVHERERWVVAVPAPDESMWRLTLTPAVINAASNVTFVVSGANKSEALQQVLRGADGPDRLPALAIHPARGRLKWMVDDAAMATPRNPDPLEKNR